MSEKFKKIFFVFLAFFVFCFNVAAQPVLVKDINPYPDLPPSYTTETLYNNPDNQEFGAVVGTSFIFANTDATNGRELWRTDLTTGATAILKDIKVGAGNSDPTNFGSAGAVAYFTADNGTHGAELWKTDGTAVGTVIVADIEPGSNGSSITNLHAAVVGANSVAVFSACTTVAGCEPWNSLGTAVTTTILGNLAAGSASSNPTRFSIFASLVWNYPYFGLVDYYCIVFDAIDPIRIQSDPHWTVHIAV